MSFMMDDEEIRTRRLTLRRIEADDWRSIQRIWEDFKQTGFVIYDAPKETGDDAVKQRIARWAAAARSGSDHVFFVSCLDGKVIGFVSLNARPEDHEVGYGFLNAYQGKGYAAESLNAVFEYMRSRGVRKITAGTAMKNLPSVALLERLGFRRTGTERVSFYKDETGEDMAFEGGIFEKEL